MPSFMIGIELVLLARIAAGSVTTASSAWKIVDLEVLLLDDRLDHELAVGELVDVGA